MDDIVVKTKNPDTLIEDLKQTFKNLKRWRWKLNKKCVYWEFLQDNYSDSWSIIVELKQAPSKFEP